MKKYTARKRHTKRKRRLQNRRTRRGGGIDFFNGFGTVIRNRATSLKKKFRTDDIQPESQNKNYYVIHDKLREIRRQLLVSSQVHLQQICKTDTRTILHRPKRKMRQNNNLFICDKNIKISHIIFR